MKHLPTDSSEWCKAEDVDRLERENAELRDKLSMVLPMALGYAHDHPVGDNLGKCRSARELLERGGADVEAD